MASGIIGSDKIHGMVIIKLVDFIAAECNRQTSLQGVDKNTFAVCKHLFQQIRELSSVSIVNNMKHALISRFGHAKTAF